MSLTQSTVGTILHSFCFISAPATDRAGGVGQLHLDRDLGDDDDDDDYDNDADDD